jgi:hypothetical protein
LATDGPDQDEEEDKDVLTAFDESAKASEFIMSNLFGMREVVEEWSKIERMLVTLHRTSPTLKPEPQIMNPAS